MGGFRDAVKIIDKTPEELEQIKADVKKAGLPEETVTVILYGLNLILWLPKLLLEQKITIARLKELLFGKGQRKKRQKAKDKTAKKNGDDDAEPEPDANRPEETAANDSSLDDAPVSDETDLTLVEATSDGRSGRNPHTAYKNAVEHHITIEDLVPGQRCPQDCGGKLYQFRPSTIIRIKGSQIGCADRYIIEKLRCSLCGEIFSAKSPEDMGTEKYDASFVAQIGIQKYFMGMPAFRQDCYHSFIELPLPHTTQWMLYEKLAGCVLPVYNQLISIAANHWLLYYDDTPLKIVDKIHSN